VNAPKPETITALTSMGYVNWPWLTLDDATKIAGLAVGLFMAVLAYRKHKLEMKILNKKLKE